MSFVPVLTHHGVLYNIQKELFPCLKGIFSTGKILFFNFPQKLLKIALVQEPKSVATLENTFALPK